MTQTVRWGVLAFLCGMLLALWFFFSQQGNGYDLYASILGGPGLEQNNVTYDVALHGTDEEMRVVSHRDFSQVDLLSLTILHDETVKISVDSEKFSGLGIKETRSDGILVVDFTNVSSLQDGDEILRWNVTGNNSRVVLSDLAVQIGDAEMDYLSVYNSMVCMGDECNHDHDFGL